MITDKRVLIAEDDPRSARLLKETLQLSGYEVTVATNGKEALDAFNKSPFPLVITDLEMPNMGGKELVAVLNNSENPPMIIVETAHSKSTVIVDIMKLGVFDYLIKPIDINELLMKSEKAIETFNLKTLKISFEKERIARMEEELSWFRWAEQHSGESQMDQKSKEQALFYNLKSSIVQGNGFGVIVSLLDLIAKSAKKEDKNYIINADIMDEVFKNNTVAKNIIKSFTEINKVLNDKVQLTEAPVSEIVNLLQEIKTELHSYTNIKSQRIEIDQARFNNEEISVNIHKDFLRRAFRELIINGMKYSPKNSTITIIFNKEGNNTLIIQFLNPAVTDQKKRTGIPMEFENLIFEPFFRMNQVINEGFDTLDIGMGLTTSKYVISKHNGIIKAFNVKDYTDIAGSRFLVNFKVTLPFHKSLP